MISPQEDPTKSGTAHELLIGQGRVDELQQFLIDEGLKKEAIDPALIDQINAAAAVLGKEVSGMVFSQAQAVKVLDLWYKDISPRIQLDDYNMDIDPVAGTRVFQLGVRKDGGFSYWFTRQKGEWVIKFSPYSLEPGLAGQEE
ncbi:hypothetical protein KBC79_05075 [Candidatus Woesebacteria bacterium]|nr:hypothetical protein [Candidatus Woesebacteria bacterium]